MVFFADLRVIGIKGRRGADPYRGLVIFVNGDIICAYRALFYDTSSVTRQGSCHLPPLGKACRKSSLFLLKCYFFKFLWQSNLKSIICFYIPLNPSVRRVRRVYTLKSNLTYNYAMHFIQRAINLTCQCFLLVTFLSRKKSDKFTFAQISSNISSIIACERVAASSTIRP